MGGDLANQVQGSSSTSSAKAKVNLHWSGRAYTQYDNWYYYDNRFGSSYYYMAKNYSRNTLGDFGISPVNTYPAGANTGFTSPINGVIKSVVYSFECVDVLYTGTFQFGLIHGEIDQSTTASTISTTNVNIGSNGDSATGNDTALEKTTTDARHRYIISKDNIDHSVNKGDMIMVACRKTTDIGTSTLYQLNFSVNIIFEEE